MSTWTSKVRLWPAAGLLALCACVETTGPSAPRAVSVLEGAVTVAGPRGFCVDRGESGGDADEAFVLLGSCAALSRSAADPAPAVLAVLTASVVEGAVPASGLRDAFPQMAAYLQSDEGRRVLSRRGDATSVVVSDVGVSDGALFLRATDSAAGGNAAVTPEYWRAILDLRGRMVTLTALGLKDRPATSGQVRAVLSDFVAAMRAANR